MPAAGDVEVASLDVDRHPLHRTPTAEAVTEPSLSRIGPEVAVDAAVVLKVEVAAVDRDAAVRDKGASKVINRSSTL